LADKLEVLLERGDGSAALRFVLGAQQLLDGDAEGLGERRQQRDRDAPSADLVGGDLLLGDVQPLG
jgi:hypothetical protein